MREYILVWPWHSMLTGGVVYSSCFKSAKLAGKNVACLFVRLCQVVLNTIFALPTEISQWAVMQHYYCFVQFSCYPVQFENFLHLKPAAYFHFLLQMPTDWPYLKQLQHCPVSFLILEMDKAHVIFSTSAFIVDHNWKDLLENCPRSAFSAILLAKSKSIKAQGGNAEVRGVKQNTVVIL